MKPDYEGKRAPANWLDRNAPLYTIVQHNDGRKYIRTETGWRNFDHYNAYPLEAASSGYKIIRWGGTALSWNVWTFMTTREETEAIAAQAKLNIGKIGRSIKHPNRRFFIDSALTLGDVTTYSVVNLTSGCHDYHEISDTEILPDVQAYRNLVTGEIYVSDHEKTVNEETSNIEFTFDDSKLRIELLAFPYDNIKAFLNFRFWSVGFSTASHIRKLALMLLHAADVLDEKSDQ